MRREGSRGPAYQIETARLILRCWRPEDAPAAQQVMETSDAHLRAFIPFTVERPRTLDEMVQWLREHRAAFDRDELYRYAIMHRSEQTLVGEGLLMDREQRGDREIGYWIAEPHVRQGYASEAATALVQVAFEVDGVEVVDLQCSPKNEASMRLAKSLGFSLQNSNDETAAWTMRVDGYFTSPLAVAPIYALDVLGQPLLERPSLRRQSRPLPVASMIEAVCAGEAAASPSASPSSPAAGASRSFHLHGDTPITDDEAESWVDRASATSLFQEAFAILVKQWGAPERDDASRGNPAPRLERHHALWDFDYFRWVLCVQTRPGGQAAVLLDCT